jgi:hypothetical protein
MRPAWPGRTTADGSQPEEDGHPGSSALRVGLLVAALALVTAAGIVVGRAVQPAASPPATTTSVASTTQPVVPPPAAKPAPLRWGPLPVRVSGHLRVGGSLAGAALAGAKLVVAGGTGSAAVLAGRAGGSLLRSGTLPGPLSAPQVFAVGGTTYVLGGERGRTPTDELLRLDLAGHRVLSAGTFEEPLAEAGVATSGGSVYLVGGWTGEKYATAVLKFTPPDTTDLLTRLPVGVRAAAVVLLRHTLYVAGGRTVGGVSRQLFAVDIDTGAVTVLDPLPRPVEQAVLLVSGTRLFLLGGKAPSGVPVAAVISIDPATGRSRPAGQLPTPLVGAAAVPFGTRTIVVDPPAGRIYRVG